MRLAWCLPLLLAACAQAPGAGPQACVVTRVADIPVSNERGFISAPAIIEDKPATLLIDTGAETTMVTPSAITNLRLGPDRRRFSTINGAGGTIVSQNALLQSLGVGGMETLDQSAAVGPLPVTQGSAMRASGLLGADWLSGFDVEFDLPHRAVRLYSVHHCSGDYVPWAGRRVSSPVQLYGRGLVLLPATLDGHAVTALLDSGANRSVLGEAAAARAGLDPDMLARDPVSHSVGVDGTMLSVHEHRFAALRVAGLLSRGPMVSVGPLRLTIADLLLGSDWLRGVRVWISYAHRRVTVQPG